MSILSPIRRNAEQKPPLGAGINNAHSLVQGLKLAFLFNEGGGNPHDLMCGHSLTTLPTWTTSRWGPAIQVTGGGGVAYTMTNLSRLLPPNLTNSGGWSAFALVDFGDASLGTNSQVLDFGDPPAGQPRWTFNYETFSNGNVGVSKNAVVDMAAGTAAPDALRSTLCWSFENDKSAEVWVNGAQTGNSNTSAFSTGGGGSAYGIIGKNFASFRLAALYFWHRNLTRAEAELLNRDPYAFIANPNDTRNLIGLSLGSWVNTTAVKVFVP